MDKVNAQELLRKYNEGLCSDEEKALIESWFAKFKGIDHKPLQEEEILSDINDILLRLGHSRPQPRILVWRKIAVAASVLLCLGIGFYFLKSQSTLRNHKVNAAFSTIVPGGSKAVLTLANGKRIILTDAKEGTIARQGNVQVTKAVNGQVIYKLAAQSFEGDALNNELNTIETPAGGEYQVQLPDGTRVWLNAKSKLRYPIRFSQTERKVELWGEGYFEVAHNAKSPFKVQSGNQLVEVLGTHFNVNAYNNEPVIRTTLLQGSVRVKFKTTEKILEPGHQADVNNSGIKVAKADIDEAVAWKNGDFAFERMRLSAIMRQISRWYNVDVTYSGNMADDEFSGSISRSRSITDVLKVLESTEGVHFKIEGRRVLVMP